MPFPLLIPIAAAAGGAALKGASSILPSKAEKENRKRLRELEVGRLGLTEEERRIMEAQFSAGMEGATREGQRAVSAQMQNATGGSGEALLRAGQAMQQAAKMEREASAAVGAADLKRKRELEQEIEDRRAFQDAARRERIDALTNIGAAALEGYGVAKGQKDLATGPETSIKSADEQAEYEFLLRSGFSEAEASRLARQ